jgi:hypothetical protein
MNRLSPAILGGVLGGAVGLLILFPRLWVLMVLTALGYFVGKLMESEELRAKIRELFSLFTH